MNLAWLNQLTTQPEDTDTMGEFFVDILRREKRFHQLILVAWSSIEFDIDRLVTYQFQLNCEYPNKKVQFLVSAPFGKKLDFLKKMRVVTLEEFHTIRQFQEHRNEFFHTFGTARVENQGPKEVERIMDEMVEASKLTYSIVCRELQGNENLLSASGSRHNESQARQLNANKGPTSQLD